MSKSKGEFLTVSLLEEKGYDPLVYRFFCLQSHYRKSLVFSYENLDNAAAAYEKLIARVAALRPQSGEQPQETEAAALRAKFTEALDNDLNTSLAVTAVYDVLKADVNDTTKKLLLAEFDRVLSLNLLEAAQKKQAQETQAAPGASDGEAAWIEEQIEARKAAKKAKNFAQADQIRDELSAKGVILVDTPQGTTWSRK